MKINIHWFRRDLRIEDNHSLYQALHSKIPTLCLFIFDEYILSKLNDKTDARVSFIFQELEKVNHKLQKHGSSLLVKYGEVDEVWKELSNEYDIEKVYCNEDYEPYAIQRDFIVESLLTEKDISFEGFQDHVVFKPGKILKADSTPYTVYSPFMRKWKSHFIEQMKKPFPTEKYLSYFYPSDSLFTISLSDLGFSQTSIPIPDYRINEELISSYPDQRDFPSIEGTSLLGVHLRFGTVSIRHILRNTSNDTFLNELIWREFFMNILFHFPESESNEFKKKYSKIPWRNDEEQFKKWCEGKTGYPIVDAGMRQLNATGWMHNRVRMITASFLCKHLLIDWRWGEAYFAEKLLDFELASNVGNWQWAASCGCDAVPYFRIFNPESQLKKFDKEGKYIRKWVKEWGLSSYPAPIVDHKWARERALSTFKENLNS